ncbi:MAG: tyrosine-type recombinase/integrase, partial [Pseudomonadales bacterium]|nr:tyrosine-type recombinase/integrase [Pseudomonadales bacterium]
APAIEILSRRKEDPRMISESKQDYVFPAESASGHIQEPKRAWAKLIERAKITDFRMHDLRHTFAVWQISEGASLYTVGKSLGHKSMQSTEVYADIEMSAIKKSIDRSVEAMLNVKNA